MGGSTCCVVNCKNTSYNSTYKFYRFPTAQHKLEQKKKWICAVRRINSDGSSWTPKPSDKICSAHFVGNLKSETVLSPSYVPSIFPSIYRTRKVNETASKNRHERYMKRILSKKEPAMKQTYLSIDNLQMDLPIDDLTEESRVGYEAQNKFVDKECQVEIMFCEENYPQTNILVCNRYIFNSSFNDAEIQTEITKSKNVISVIPVKKNRKHEKCGTVEKIFADKAVGLDFQFGDIDCSDGFIDFESIKIEEQLSETPDAKPNMAFV